ncbi:MAG: DUF5668 domain-containing protein [Desulfobacterales bacterium]|nr:DUF5668 domain-containing protein [Desulfobacterales bacterium]
MTECKEKEDRRGMVIGGLIVLGIGLVFLLGNLGVIPHIGNTWPLILVVVGVALLIGAVIKKDKSELPPQNQ